MRIARSGSRRWCGTTEIVKHGNRPEIKDLEVKFPNVEDFNSSRTHHDYTVEFSDEELDQLLKARLERFCREIRDRIVALKDPERDPVYDQRLRELLDEYAFWRVASAPRRVRPENGN